MGPKYQGYGVAALALSYQGFERRTIWTTDSITGTSIRTPTINNAAKLDAWLIQHCRETHTASIATREVLRYGPYAVRDKHALDEAIAELTEAGRVRLVKDGKRREIEVNPALVEKS